MTGQRRADPRLNISFAFSLGLHAAVAGLWFWLHSLRPPEVIRLESVELIEVLKETQRIVEPAQHAPRNVLEFLKMALPQVRKTEPREVAPPEVQRERPADSPAPIDLAQRARLQPVPVLNLSRQPPPSASAALSEVAPRQPAQARAAVPVEAPAIAVEDIGRRRVAAPAPGISLTRAQGPPAPALQEIRPAAPVRPVGVPREAVKEALVAWGPPRPAPRAASPADLPVGFGRGPVAGLKSMAVPSLPPVARTPRGEEAAAREAPGARKAVEILGPISGRRILHSILPSYPDWARQRGVEADVAIRFVVSPEGMVREKPTVEQTSGHLELDRVAIAAIQQWRFEPLRGGGDQWGIVIFRFRLA